MIMSRKSPHDIALGFVITQLMLKLNDAKLGDMKDVYIRGVRQLKQLLKPQLAKDDKSTKELEKFIGEGKKREKAIKTYYNTKFGKGMDYSIMENQIIDMWDKLSEEMLGILRVVIDKYELMRLEGITDTA